MSVMLLGSLVGLGVADSKAQTVDLPHVCTLSQDTIQSIKENIEAAPARIESSEVSFVIIYRLDTNNWGQLIEGGGTTAPVICTDPDLNVMEVTEDTALPSDPDERVDILNADGISAVRVQEKTSGTFATRICLTSKAVESNPVSCFVIEMVQ